MFNHKSYKIARSTLATALVLSVALSTLSRSAEAVILKNPVLSGLAILSLAASGFFALRI